MRLGLETAGRAAATVLTVTLVAACGQPGVASESGGASASDMGLPSRGPPSPSTHASAAVSDHGGTQVSIDIDRERFADGEPIELRIHNGLNDAVATVDQQAFCGVLRLDRAVGTAWEEVRNCATGPPPRDVVIGPGEERTVHWEPGLGKGVYRARLVYATGDVFVPGSAMEVTSRILTVD